MSLRGQIREVVANKDNEYEWETPEELVESLCFTVSEWVADWENLPNLTERAIRYVSETIDQAMGMEIYREL